MDEPLAELAAYSRRKSTVPDQDLVWLTAAARAGGSSWNAIAEACGVRAYEDTTGAVLQPPGIIPDTGAWLLFRATQCSTQKLTGGSVIYPPLTWLCHTCGQQITDRTAVGWPVHIEHGHEQGCARLARDQAADAERRRAEPPRQVLHSESALGPLQRHWLRERITDDCPRCGWHGYFHDYIATIDDDWSAGICDDCYADLRPDIAVTVKFFSATSPIDGKAVAAIRQRTRSDSELPDLGLFPDLGQEITWQLSWQHTTMLIDDRRGNCSWYITEISPLRGRADRRRAVSPLLATGRGPAAVGSRGLSGVTSHRCGVVRGSAGPTTGLVIPLEDRLGSQQAQQVHYLIEIDEYGLALEEIAGVLAHARAPVTDQERQDMLALTWKMKMDDLVPHALGFCPRAG